MICVHERPKGFTGTQDAHLALAVAEYKRAWSTGKFLHPGLRQRADEPPPFVMARFADAPARWILMNSEWPEMYPDKGVRVELVAHSSAPLAPHG